MAATPIQTQRLIAPEVETVIDNQMTARVREDQSMEVKADTSPHARYGSSDAAPDEKNGD